MMPPYAQPSKSDLGVILDSVLFQHIIFHHSQGSANFTFQLFIFSLPCLYYYYPWPGIIIFLLGYYKAHSIVYLPSVFVVEDHPCPMAIVFFTNMKPEVVSRYWRVKTEHTSNIPCNRLSMISLASSCSLALLLSEYILPQIVVTYCHATKLGKV